MKYFFPFLIAFLLISCNQDKTEFLSYGTYRAELKVQDNQILPFLFKVKDANTIEVYNAEEVIEVDEIEYKNDSVYIQTPVFEGYIVAKIEDQKLIGSFVKESLDRIVPFSAEKNSTRFKDKLSKPITNISGSWETVFSPNSETDKYIAKGIFKQKGNKITGTFRTTTGDYRYLEGIISGDSLKLSTFDGAHAFLFSAKVTDSTIVGNFYSGNHWKEPFVAKLNNDYELPHEDNLTYIKEGYDKFNFSFPDETGKLISLSDERFKNKVVLVQIMGTWCPNCLDESKYYTKYLEEKTNENIEIVALAFEVAKTKEKAFERIKRLKERIGIEYPVLLAQYGNAADKKLAAEKLPVLNHVLSYPTTIFIDKKGNVRKIHTGFNGPATGQKYLDFVNEFEEFVAGLLEEESFYLNCKEERINNRLFQVCTKSPGNLLIKNSKGEIIYKHQNNPSEFKFIDFNKDGYLDIILEYLTNTPGTDELLLFNKEKNTFEKVIDFINFPSAIKIKGTDYYYSYHKSGCADSDWDSDLFRIINNKATRIGNIEGVGCKTFKDTGIYINNVKGDSSKLIKFIKREEGYWEGKWDFINKYWNKNYLKFK